MENVEPYTAEELRELLQDRKSHDSIQVELPTGVKWEVPGDFYEDNPETYPYVYDHDKWEDEQGFEIRRDYLNHVEMEHHLLVTDAFASVFRQDPQTDKESSVPEVNEFFQTLLETPDFLNTRNLTKGNKMASRLAAVPIAEELIRLVKKTEEENGPEECRKEGMELEVFAAVGKAVRRAEQDVETYQSVSRAIGMEEGTAETMNVNQVKYLMNIVRHNETVKQIMQRAGRFRLAAQQAQRQRSLHGQDEMVGFELEGELSRALPMELAKLEDEDYEYDVLRRFVERQLMCREFRGVENKNRGPIVLLIDESGSMSGERIINAKAFGLAMYYIARHQKRPMVIIPFSGSFTAYVNPKPSEVMKWLQLFMNGGTVLGPPLQETIRQLNEHSFLKGKADVIIVSDGDVNLDIFTEKEYKAAAKQHNVRTTSIIIQSQPGRLADISDEVHIVNGIEVGTEAVNRCFSI
jgi:uncharacterized protein with von Willebrand factor type A (vWA) domain